MFGTTRRTACPGRGAVTPAPVVTSSRSARVRVLTGSLTPLKDVVVSPDTYRGGASLAMHALDGDGAAEVLVSLTNTGKPALIGVRNTGDAADVLTPDPAMAGAVFVG